MLMLCLLIYLIIVIELFNLFFIHSLAPPFLSLVVVPPDVGADVLGPPNRASIRTPIVIPIAVKKGFLFSHQVSESLYPRIS